MDERPDPLPHTPPAPAATGTPATGPTPSAPTPTDPAPVEPVASEQPESELIDAALAAPGPHRDRARGQLTARPDGALWVARLHLADLALDPTTLTGPDDPAGSDPAAATVAAALASAHGDATRDELTALLSTVVSRADDSGGRRGADLLLDALAPPHPLAAPAAVLDVARCVTAGRARRLGRCLHAALAGPCRSPVEVGLWVDAAVALEPHDPAAAAALWEASCGPDHPAALLGRMRAARAYLAGGRPADTVRVLDGWVGHSPSLEPALRSMACIALGQLGRHDDARDVAAGWKPSDDPATELARWWAHATVAAAAGDAPAAGRAATSAARELARAVRSAASPVGDLVGVIDPVAVLQAAAGTDEALDAARALVGHGCAPHLELAALDVLVAQGHPGEVLDHTTTSADWPVLWRRAAALDAAGRPDAALWQQVLDAADATRAPVIVEVVADILGRGRDHALSTRAISRLLDAGTLGPSELAPAALAVLTAVPPRGPLAPAVSARITQLLSRVTRWAAPQLAAGPGSLPPDAAALAALLCGGVSWLAHCDLTDTDTALCALDAAVTAAPFVGPAARAVLAADLLVLDPCADTAGITAPLPAPPPPAPPPRAPRPPGP